MNKKKLEKLEELASSVHRNDDGDIIKIFLYNDATNPMNTADKKQQEKLWNEYLEKIKFLSTLNVK